MLVVEVDLHISAEEYQLQYQTPGVQVYARSRDGRTVKFPASILRPHIGREGIYGQFAISFSEQGKFQSIKKLSGL